MRDLVERAQRGDRQAFAALAEGSIGELYNLAQLDARGQRIGAGCGPGGPDRGVARPSRAARSRSVPPMAPPDPRQLRVPGGRNERRASRLQITGRGSGRPTRLAISRTATRSTGASEVSAPNIARSWWLTTTLVYPTMKRPRCSACRPGRSESRLHRAIRCHARRARRRQPPRRRLRDEDDPMTERSSLDRE